MDTEKHEEYEHKLTEEIHKLQEDIQELHRKQAERNEQHCKDMNRMEERHHSEILRKDQTIAD